MTLSSILEIREVVHRESVCGLTKEEIYPHERLEIEGVSYRVCGLSKKKKVTAFFATVLPIACGMDLDEMLKRYV